MSKRLTRTGAGLLGLALFAACSQQAPEGYPASSPTRPAVTPAPALQPSRTSVAVPTASALGESPQERLTQALSSLQLPQGVSLTLVAEGEHAGVFYGGEEPMPTASIVKVALLAATLLRCQETGVELSQEERALAAAMITYSDNDAADYFYQRLGGGEELEAFFKSASMSSTVVTAGEPWGLTTTTAGDQLLLLDYLTRGESALSSEHQAFILQLMGGVVEEQRWGVGTLPGSAELKNGWLDLPAEESSRPCLPPASCAPPSVTWVVNSMGVVVLPSGQRVKIAVLSSGWEDYSLAVETVGAVARAAGVALS